MSSVEGAFVESPSELLARARSASARGAVAVLRDRHELSIDAEGRWSRNRHRIVAVLDRDAVPRVGVVTLGWTPWCMERPVLRARVVTSRGEEHWLDPESIVENAPGGSGLVLSDRRSLSAPLPRVGVGSVIEVVERWEEHRPRFAAGRVRRMKIPVGAPLEVVLTAPEHTAVQWEGADPDIAAGQWRWRIPGLDAAPDPVEAAPVDHVSWPALTISTGASWDEVAAGYGRLLDGARGELPDDWVAAVRSAPAEERLRAAYRLVTERTRYTGLSLGAGELVPRSPAEVARTGFGDCKDLALLLAELLRAVDIPASVALVAVEGPPPSLPGIEAFDHCIVHAGGRWIDPSAYRPFGELPVVLEGRRALLADGPEPGWRPLPEPSSEAHTVSDERRFVIALDRPTRVTWKVEARGWIADRIWPGAEPDPEDYAGYAEHLFRSDRVLSVRARPLDDDGPAALVVEVDEVGTARCDEDGGHCWVQLDVPLGVMPDVLDDWPEERDVPLALPPRRGRSRWAFELPPGFTAVHVPPERSWEIGPVRWSASFGHEPGLLTAEIAFDTGHGTLQPAEARALGERVRALREPIELPLAYEPQARFEAGDARAAMAAVDAHVASHPDQPFYVGWRALLLARTGQRGAALAALQDIADEALAAYWRGRVLLHDGLGRELGYGLDQPGAVAALRIATDRGVPDAARWLGWAMQHGRNGVRFGEGADPDGAIAVLLQRRARGDDVEEELLECLVGAGRTADAITWVERTASHLQGHPAVLVALACERGVEVATGLLARRGLDGMQPAAALLHAQRGLSPLRRYDLQEALLGVAGTVMPAMRARLAAAVFPVRHETRPPAPDSPAAALHALARAGWRDDRDAVPLATGGTADAWWALLVACRRMASEDVLLDHVCTRSRVVREEPGLAALVSVELGPVPWLVALAWEDGWKLVGTQDDAAHVARRAAAHFERGEAAAGRFWVELLLAVLEGLDTPLLQEGSRTLAPWEVGATTEAGRLWSQLERTDAARALFAGVCGLGAGGEVPDLGACPPSLELGVQTFVRDGLATAGRHVDAVPHARRIAELSGDTPEARSRLAYDLARAGLAEEARELAASALGAGPDPTVVGRHLYVLANTGAAVDAVVDAARRAHAIVPPGHFASNNVAWYLLFGGEDEHEAAWRRCEATYAAGARQPYFLNTAATAAASTGRIDRALELLREGSPVGEAGLEPAAGLVRGLIASALGLDGRAWFEAVPGGEGAAREVSARALADRAAARPIAR